MLAALTPAHLQVAALVVEEVVLAALRDVVLVLKLLDVAITVLLAVRRAVMALVVAGDSTHLALLVLLQVVQSELFGPAQLARSHRQIRGIYK